MNFNIHECFECGAVGGVEGKGDQMKKINLSDFVERLPTKKIELNLRKTMAIHYDEYSTHGFLRFFQFDRDFNLEIFYSVINPFIKALHKSRDTVERAMKNKHNQINSCRIHTFLSLS